MIQKKNFILSITALLLFTQCSNNVPDTTYDNDTLGCNCDDKDVLCDPPPPFVFYPLTPLSPLPISIPKVSGFPHYDDWDSIFLSVFINCGLDTNRMDNRMDTITITSYEPFTSCSLCGRNVDGTGSREFVYSSDSNWSELTKKANDYIKSAMMKNRYYVIEDDVDSVRYLEYYNVYKEIAIVPISIDLRLIPEK